MFLAHKLRVLFPIALLIYIEYIFFLYTGIASAVSKNLAELYSIYVFNTQITEVVSKSLAELYGI